MSLYYVFIFILVICVLFSITAQKSIYSPLGTYSVIWLVVAILFANQEKFGYSYIAVSEETWALLILATVGFAFGVLIAMHVSKSKRQERRDPPYFDHQFIGTLTIILGFLGGVGVIYKWYILITRFGGLNNAISSIPQVRIEIITGAFAFPLPAQLLSNLLLPAALFAGGLAATKKKHIITLFIILLLLGISDIAVGGRGDTFHGILISGNSFLLGTAARYSWIRARVAAIGVVLVSFGMLIGVSVVRVLRGGVAAKSIPSFIISTFRSLYHYLVGPIPAMSVILRIQDPSTHFAAYTLGGLYRPIRMALSKAGFNVLTAPPKPYMDIPMGFNSYPYAYLLYSDFGVLGMIMAAALIGGISTMAYINYLRFPSVTALYLTSLFMTLVIYSPRDLTTFWFTTFIMVVLVFIAGRVSSHKSLNRA